jgi:hypothetical protein
MINNTNNNNNNNNDNENNNISIIKAEIEMYLIHNCMWSFIPVNTTGILLLITRSMNLSKIKR